MGTVNRNVGLSPRSLRTLTATELRTPLMLFKTREHYCYVQCSSSAPLKTRAIWKILKHVFLASLNTNEVK